MKPGSILLSCFLSSAIHFSHAQDTGSVVQTPKLFQIHGSISVGSTFYYATGINNRRKPLSWHLSGAPHLSVKGMQVPVFALAGDPDRYYRQPFNQFGFSPRYKWVTCHAGYRSLNYSPFTLAGHSFFGAALDANPGKLRASIMYGRMQKAIGEDPLLPYDIIPAYKRMGYGAKLGYGTASGFIDFSIFRARDDTSTQHRYTRSFLKPEENLVSGVKIHQVFLKRLTWDADLAVSALNHDSRASNAVIPEMKWLNKLGNVFRPRTSAGLYKAGQTSLTLQDKKLFVRAGYKRIEPGYKSLGAYYMQNDLEDIQLSAGYTFFSGKVDVRGSIGLQHDNLKRTLLNTTKRTTTSADISVSPTAGYSADLQYFNYGFVQHGGINPLHDSLRIAQANHHVSTSHRFTKADEKHARTIMCTLTYQELANLNHASVDRQSLSNLFLQGLYSFSLVPARFNFSSVVQWTGTKNFAGFNSMKGVTISVSKGFLEEAKMQTAFSLGCFGNTYQSYISNDQSSSSVVSATASCNISLKKKHSVSMDLTLLKNRALIDSFTEFTASTAYTIRF